MDNLTTPLLRLPLHLKNGPNPLTTKRTPTYLFGYLEMMSLPIRGARARPACVCGHVRRKAGGQGHYSLIRPLRSARVISSAWGLPTATSTISHFPLAIYPGDNHPDPSTVAQAAGDRADARQCPQRCLR